MQIDLQCICGFLFFGKIENLFDRSATCNITQNCFNVPLLLVQIYRIQMAGRVIFFHSYQDPGHQLPAWQLLKPTSSRTYMP